MTRQAVGFFEKMKDKIKRIGAGISDILFTPLGLLEEFINYIEDPERPHREWIFQIIIMLAALSCFLKLIL